MTSILGLSTGFSIENVRSSIPSRGWATLPMFYPNGLGGFLDAFSLYNFFQEILPSLHEHDEEGENLTDTNIHFT